jgi:hypothetical protein
MNQPSTRTISPDGAASLLVAALEHTWQTIRIRHPELPQAVLVVASGAEGKRLNLGHFAPHRWQVKGADRHEVLVGGEGLQRGPLEVLGTLLHEAAHGLAQASGVQDTSPPGPLPQPPLRHPRPRAGPGGGQRPADRLVGHHCPRAHRRRLRRPAPGAPGRAGAVARRHEHRSGAGPRSRNLRGCGRRIRVAKATLAEAPILCSRCSQPFQPDDQDD